MPTTDELELPLAPGELWWGGAVADGAAMPFGRAPHHRDLARNAGFADAEHDGANQSAPLLVSSHGRYVWSENPFAFTFADGSLTVSGDDVTVGSGGATLRDAFTTASRQHFPASGTTPDERMFSAPQYNTWMENPFLPTQEGVLDYVSRILGQGLPPGVVMIDDRWSQDYGAWRFDEGRFPDPAAMVATLHEWGCPVMLWVVPYVSPDSAEFRELEGRGLLLRRPDGEPVVRRWWNGYSAMLDLSHPDALGWLREQWAPLTAIGVDGFKLDGADLRYYADDDVAHDAPRPRTDLCEAWAALGSEYAFNEMRACWKLGGRPLAQRLHDKPSSWGSDGLGSLIPELVAQGLIGHPYTCPDMIGGGLMTGVTTPETVDQELYVRYAQVAALAPMMQFSLSPARVLDAEHRAAVASAVAVRDAHLPVILDLVRSASRTGEPVLRALAYHHPGFEHVADEFLLGEDVLVAPVLEPGATSRPVILPPGTWLDAAGAPHTGPGEVLLEVDLHTLPVFRRLPDDTQE
ncbi:glycoside hydrolase family 31 protein [Actinotalea sp. M2MS4P-6]|uniref:glycoside hydrolase family 31 protein n=1 Tax=Actinotalea sp. M2MS4P-6 TaxID=2983762 RepID=UPI0021E3F6AB|nr:glycoside hydrolase family 31 protein [Actinotalea sp. M2MS4P-6]MCV2395684.1 glycoside hydrolase family 31 protein [Actinotalea sp. M2MS4P-6]